MKSYPAPHYSNPRYLAGGWYATDSDGHPTFCNGLREQSGYDAAMKEERHRSHIEAIKEDKRRERRAAKTKLQAHSEALVEDRNRTLRALASKLGHQARQARAQAQRAQEHMQHCEVGRQCVADILASQPTRKTRTRAPQTLIETVIEHQTDGLKNSSCAINVTHLY